MNISVYNITMMVKKDLRNKLRISLKLFIYSLLISSSTFGGGFVIISMMKKQYVDKLKLLEGDEMYKLLAFAQASPGALAVNSAVIVGYDIAGAMGAAASFIGIVVPPVVTLSIVTVLYNIFIDNKIISCLLAGMKLGVCAVIIDALAGMVSDLLKEKQVIYIIIAAGSFAAVAFFKVNVVFILAVGVIAGIISTYRNKEC
jgi:chromate transporter